ncbi:hypothetical protein BJ742DRAFT_794932 [Cladochytrium replicatum]|nr:hypothetical protein BJ742DRAFT_794932 [Cladochytrium replicatum]
MAAGVQSWSALFKHKPVIHPAVERLELDLDEHPTLRGPEGYSGGTDLSGTVTLELSEPLEDAVSVVVIFQGLRRLTSAPTPLGSSVSGSHLEPPRMESSSSSSSSSSSTTLPNYAGAGSAAPSPRTGSATIGRSGIPRHPEDDSGEVILVGEKELWSAASPSSATAVQGLPAGHHEWRLYFKLPGTLPKTHAGHVAYTLRAIIHRGAPSSSASPTPSISENDIETVEEVIVRRVQEEGGTAGDPVPGYTMDPPDYGGEEPPPY